MIDFLLFVFSADRSMYHALGYSTILYIQAVMTFDMVGVPLLILTSCLLLYIVTEMNERSSTQVMFYPFPHFNSFFFNVSENDKIFM